MRQKLARHAARAVAALLLILAAAGPATAQDNAKPEAAAQYIRQLSDTAIERLGAPGLSEAERKTRGRDLLQKNFAGPMLGQFVLARYWRSATEAQRERFLELLQEVALQRFLPAFQNLRPEQVAVERAFPDPQSNGLIRVETRIDVPDRGPVRLGWRLRPIDGSFEIVDIMAEGVSMAITLRGEYTSVIERNGGQISALLRELEMRVGRGDPAAGDESQAAQQ